MAQQVMAKKKEKQTKPPLQRGEVKATAALACGIISCLLFPPIGVVGVILAKQAEKERYIGNHAKTGKVLSIIGLITGVLLVIFLIFVLWVNN